MPDFRVLDVTLEPGGGSAGPCGERRDEGGCPACGVLSGLIKDRPTSRVEDPRTGWCR